MEVPRPGSEPLPQQWLKLLQRQCQILKLLHFEKTPGLCFCICFDNLCLSIGIDTPFILNIDYWYGCINIYNLCKLLNRLYFSPRPFLLSLVLIEHFVWLYFIFSLGISFILLFFEIKHILFLDNLHDMFFSPLKNNASAQNELKMPSVPFV